MNSRLLSLKIIVYSNVFGLILLATMSSVNNINLFDIFAQTNIINSKVNTTAPISIQNNTNNETTKVNDTFTLSGPISSLVYVPSNNSNSKTVNLTEQLNSSSKFILSGNWSISSKQGKITDFKTSFTKVLADGNKRHTHDLVNFKQDNNTKAQLTGDNNLSVKGLVDAKLNKDTPWNSTNVNINIEKGNTIAIILDNKQTSNHFEYQPIYGIVTSIIDKNGTKIK